MKVGVGGGDLVEVLEGLKPGERVATEGSFRLRAEELRACAGLDRCGRALVGDWQRGEGK